MTGSEKELPILWQQQQRNGVRAASQSSIEKRVLFIPLLTELHGSFDTEVLIPFYECINLILPISTAMTLFHWSGQSSHKVTSF